MNYTKSEPYDIKHPEKYHVPYYPNFQTINEIDVFKNDHLDEPILYTPFKNDVPIGDVMEHTFHKKCPITLNAFFYPQSATEFFKKDDEIKNVYSYPCSNMPFYNTTTNLADDKRHSDILSSPCNDPENFFKNNQLQSSFNNYAQTEPLRKTHKYISSYDKNINMISCTPPPCSSSHRDASAL